MIWLIVWIVGIPMGVGGAMYYLTDGNIDDAREGDGICSFIIGVFWPIALLGVLGYWLWGIVSEFSLGEDLGEKEKIMKSLAVVERRISSLRRQAGGCQRDIGEARKEMNDLQLRIANNQRILDVNK